MKKDCIKYCNKCMYASIKETEFPCNGCSKAEEKKAERACDAKKEIIQDTVIFHAYQLMKILIGNGYDLESIKGDNYKSLDIGVFGFPDKENLVIENICTKMKFQKTYRKGEFNYENEMESKTE